MKPSASCSGILTSTAAVGFYNIAWSLHVATYSLISALGQVLFPTFSHLQGLGRREQSSRVIVQATWSLGILSAGLYVPLFVFAKDLLMLWVGPEVANPAYGVLRVLAVAGLVASLFIVSNFYLMGIGMTKWLAWLAFAQGAITLLVSLILIPSLGLHGAAWGILVSTLSHMTFLYLTWKRFLREVDQWPSVSLHAGGSSSERRCSRIDLDFAARCHHLVANMDHAYPRLRGMYGWDDGHADLG